MVLLVYMCNQTKSIFMVSFQLKCYTAFIIKYVMISDAFLVLLFWKQNTIFKMKDKILTVSKKASEL